MLDIRQSSTYAAYLKNIGWQVDKERGNYYYSKKFPLVGAFLKLQRPEKIFLKDIRMLSKKRRAFRTIIELKTSKQKEFLKKNGYKLSKSPYLPTKTLVVNLKKPISELKSDLSKDAKRSLKKTQNIKIKRININEIEKFRKSWRKSVGMGRYVPSTKNLSAMKRVFNKNCLILYQTNASRHPGTGAVFLKDDMSAYYWYAFTDEKGRKTLSQYKLVWEGILWAKNKGVKYFDFEGIYDERFPKKSWRGFTLFKKKFGGKIKKYPGALIETRLPL